MIEWLISIVVSLIWMFVLYLVGGRKNGAGLFFMLLYAPTIMVYLVLAILLRDALGVILQAVGIFGIIILLAILMERAAWGYTLYDAAGNEKLGGFAAVYYIPILGMILYWVLK